MTTRKTAGKVGRRRSRGGRTPQDTSAPTGRAAYTETRRWLLEKHGPVCAYCGNPHAPRGITLDHVTPRRGQSAYDRRDNLVLACKRCNAGKADKPFLVYLLANPTRATNLLRFGSHLSEGILDQLRPLAGPIAPVAAKHAKPPPPRVVYGADDDDSPYLETPYRE